MNITVLPRFNGGKINAIASKSHAHRALICAALAESPSQLKINCVSQDIIATCRCLTEMGCKINSLTNVFHITPGTFKHSPILDCGESGSTLRFLLPVSAALGNNANFIGSGRLPNRPLEPLLSEMKKHGVKFGADKLPFSICGKMNGGDFFLPGNVSSQYITGLMLALPIIGGGNINILSPLESMGYINLTMDTVREFGNIIHKTDNGFCVHPGKYTGRSLQIDGDWSNCAFWLCAGALSNPVTVFGLNKNSSQCDKSIITILKQMGANVFENSDSVTVSPSELHAVDIDAGNIPDLIPVLAVTAAFCTGVTHIYNASRLRLKESDRIATVYELINSLGGKAELKGDDIFVYGTGLKGGTVKSHNDHRLVMSAAIAALNCKNNVEIIDYEGVIKSYPEFFNHLKSLGGETVV